MITSASDKQTQPEHHNIMPLDFSDAVQSRLQSETTGYVGYMDKLINARLLFRSKSTTTQQKLPLDDGIYSEHDTFTLRNNRLYRRILEAKFELSIGKWA